LWPSRLFIVLGTRVGVMSAVLDLDFVLILAVIAVHDFRLPVEAFALYVLAKRPSDIPTESSDRPRISPRSFSSPPQASNDFPDKDYACYRKAHQS
jgi:hypothetical protein